MVIPTVTTLDDARGIIRNQAEDIEKLSNENAWLKRQIFGSKSEHYIPQDDTPSLFPEPEASAPPEDVTHTVASHERQERQANALSEIPADLPREERIIDVPKTEREA